MAPDALQPELGAQPLHRTGRIGSDQQPSTASLIGAALPLLAAGFALISGLSTEVTPSGSWGFNDTVEAVLAVVGIGALAGVCLVALFRAWGSERSGWFKFFLFLGIACVYLASAVASLVLAFMVSFTRDPPEC
jgi:hypothetical protein